MGGLLCLATLALLQVETSPGSALIRNSYDGLFELTSFRRPAMSNSEVIIVYLDLDSYLQENQNPSEVWNRRLQTRLLQTLQKEGATAVVFDFVFGDPWKDPEVDREFAAAMRAQGRVVLGAELNQSSQDTRRGDWIRSATLVLPTEPLRSAAAAWGIADLVVEDDFVVRQHFDGLTDPSRPSLLKATLAILGPSVPGTQLGSDRSRWTRYYGPPLTIPHVSYSSVLRPGALPPGLFRGKVVLVGARPMTPSFTGIRDEFRSPFHTWGETELFLPGVEVHATQILNGIRGDWLRRSSDLVECAGYGLFALMVGWGLVRLRPLPATLTALGLELAVVGVASVLFVSERLWSPWLIASAVQIPAALGTSFLVQSFDWYRRRRALEEERRRAELKIREQAALLDKAQDAILVYDLTHGVTYANPGATSLYGWTLQELNDVTAAVGLFDFTDPPLREIKKKVCAEGEWQGELEQRNREGSVLQVSSRWTLIRHEDGRPKAFLIINTDVTERRRLEQHLQRVERMETIGSLAGGMAHDLNNMFSPMQLGLQMLRRQKFDEENLRTLEVVENSCRRGVEMVKQVLLYARGERVEKKRVNVGHLLRDMERFVKDTFPAEIEVARMAPEDLWAIEGNEAQLHQVLLNLCVNARDAMMPQGGHLTLAADNASLDEKEATSLTGGRPGEFVVLWVSDTGKGIPAALQSKLFEPFFTTKPLGQGTGLGLVTVATLVREHQGFLGLKTEEGVGTTFEVYLPRQKRPITTGMPSEDPRTLDLQAQGECVILAGGGQVLQEMMRSSLIGHGYSVEVGETMLEAFRAADSGSRPPGCLVCHLTGRETLADLNDPLQLFRDRWPQMPVLWVGSEEVRLRLPELPGGASSQYLPLPFSAEVFLSALARSMARPGAST